MSIRSGQSVTKVFTTSNPASSALVNADSLPVGTLYVNGTSNAAAVTVTNIAAGLYKAQVTLPTLAIGDLCDLFIAATVSGTAGGGIIWSDTCDLALSALGGVLMGDGMAHGGTLGSSTATLALSRINVTSQTSNVPAILALGNGSGDGIRTTGGAGGAGLSCTGSIAPGAIFTGSSTSAGIRAVGGSTNAPGIQADGGTGGHGFLATGGGGAVTDGIRATTAGTGHGINALGGGTATSSAAGAGLNLQGGGASLNAGGVAGAGLKVTGGAGAASTNGAAPGASFSGGGTNTVASAAHGFQVTGTSNGDGMRFTGAGTGVGATSTPAAVGFGSGGGSTVTEASIWTYATRTLTAATGITSDGNPVNQAQLANLDATVSSRLAAASYMPPDNTTLAHLGTTLEFSGGAYRFTTPALANAPAGGGGGGGTVSGYAAGQDPATLVLGAVAGLWNTAGTIGAAINTAAQGGGGGGFTAADRSDLGAVKAKTDLLGSGVPVLTAPVASGDGTVRLTRGADYRAVDGLAVQLAVPEGGWPDLTGASVRLNTSGLSYPATVLPPAGVAQGVQLELTAAQTTAVVAGPCQWWATLANGDDVPLSAAGVLVVQAAVGP